MHITANGMGIAQIGEQSWTEINRLADSLDVALRTDQNKIAIGCQLAFIAIKEFGTPEWTDEINGPTKRRYARSLIKRFQTRFARKGVLVTHNNKDHSKQKPLWALTLYWRGDGKPLVMPEQEPEDTKINNIPSDIHNPDLQSLTFFPDKGCLKVELPLSCSWRQISAYVSGLYKLAQEGGLVSEKYLDNGLCIGSGSTCSLFLGGAHPSNSPFLKDPHLVISLMTYWQAHPCLSYLFSGFGVGAFGLAPRLDEIRKDGLYELETALEKMSSLSSGVSFAEELDDIGRHLLTDIYGNHDHAEICLDQFYPAGDPYNQRGIIELRSFDMAPDDRSALLLLTLARSLVTWLQKHPQKPPFKRWKRKLHNRYMMPHFLLADLSDVLDDLSEDGQSFHKNWFLPLLTRKFPKYGKVVLDDVQLELSQALEPFNTPSSRNASLHAQIVERLQLKVTAFDRDKHIVTCNDMILPLSDPDDDGVQIAAIRFQSRLPASSSRTEDKPHLRPNCDLTFELIDKQSRRSLGGFFFHTSALALTMQATQNLDLTEARKKRLDAFVPFAPYEGDVSIRPAPIYYEFPGLIDARRV